MDWNNGTIFRVFVNIADKSPVSATAPADLKKGVPLEIDCKVDIAQQELTGNVLLGVENYVVKPRTQHGTASVQTALQNYWASRSFLQFESFQLAPYIDFTSQLDTQANSVLAQESNSADSRNTQVFARVPLIATPSLGNAQLTTEATFAGDRVFNKDSVMYEMRNNPLALSNGRLRFRVLDENGVPIPRINTSGEDVSYLKGLAFTLVVYKPNEKYT